MSDTATATAPAAVTAPANDDAARHNAASDAARIMQSSCIEISKTGKVKLSRPVLMKVAASAYSAAKKMNGKLDHAAYISNAADVVESLADTVGDLVDNAQTAYDDLVSRFDGIDNPLTAANQAKTLAAAKTQLNDAKQLAADVESGAYIALVDALRAVASMPQGRTVKGVSHTSFGDIIRLCIGKQESTGELLNRVHKAFA